MAGLYSDAPAPQIMYDRDGSSGIYVPTGGGTPVAFSAAQLLAMNDWSTSSTGQFGSTGRWWVAIIFPVLMDVSGIFFSMATHNLGPSQDGPQWSANTTNGNDGTWTGFTPSPGPGGHYWFGNGGSGITFLPQARQNIGTMALTGVKSVRIGGGNSTSGNPIVGAYHLYGKPSTGQANDRLRLWHPTLDEEVGGAYFDYGDAGRGGTFDKTFRIRNNSTNLTANDVVLSFEEYATVPTPSVASQMSISQGGAFAATQNLGSIAPGGTSGICTLRLASLSTAALGLWRQRLLAVAGSWT